MVQLIRLKLGCLRFDFYFLKEKISLTRTCYKAIRGSIRLSPYKWKHNGSNSRWNRNNSWKRELKSLSTSALKEDKETCSSGNNQRQDSHLSWGNNQGQRLLAYSWKSIPKEVLRNLIREKSYYGLQIIHGRANLMIALDYTCPDLDKKNMAKREEPLPSGSAKPVALIKFDKINQWRRKQLFRF